MGDAGEFCKVMHHTTIPWQDEESWSQAAFFFNHSFKDRGLPDNGVKLVNSLSFAYEQLEENVNKLCGMTCSRCSDICCRKATVWYDFRDLVFLFFQNGMLPERQLSRKADLSCSSLGHDGCLLPRIERPFICSWYICSAQSQVVADWRKAAVPEADIISILRKMQKERKELEQVFLQCLTRISHQ